MNKTKYTDQDFDKTYGQNKRFQQISKQDNMIGSLSKPKGNLHIMLVDDEESIIYTGKQMLERYCNYNTTGMTNAVEALEVFRADPDKFDLVITDMIMPKITGDTLAREVIKIRPGTPIILCTGYSQCIIEAKAKELGGVFLMKPFELYELAMAIHKVLHKG